MYHNPPPFWQAPYQGLRELFLAMDTIGPRVAILKNHSGPDALFETESVQASEVTAGLSPRTKLQPRLPSRICQDGHK